MSVGTSRAYGAVPHAHHGAGSVLDADWAAAKTVTRSATTHTDSTDKDHDMASGVALAVKVENYAKFHLLGSLVRSQFEWRKLITPSSENNPNERTDLDYLQSGKLRVK
jgi:hypothetical protein